MTHHGIRSPQLAAGVAANRLAAEDSPAHDWDGFVLSFPPHLVRDYVRRFGIGPEHTVFDPFCGTGTTLVECKKRGIPSVGIEAHPWTCFASRTKTDWRVDAEGLVRHAHEVAELATQTLHAQGIEDEPPLCKS